MSIYVEFMVGQVAHRHKLMRERLRQLPNLTSPERRIWREAVLRDIRTHRNEARTAIAKLRRYHNVRHVS